MPRKKFKIAPFLFLAAPLFFFGLFIIGPSCYSVYLSFTKWDFLSPIKFVGLRNFRILFSDPVFLRCLMNNVKWIIVFLYFESWDQIFSGLSPGCAVVSDDS